MKKKKQKTKRKKERKDNKRIGFVGGKISRFQSFPFIIIIKIDEVFKSKNCFLYNLLVKTFSRLLHLVLMISFYEIF